MEILSTKVQECISQIYESIEEAVKCIWGLKAHSIERLVGYDSCNYLIEVQSQDKNGEREERKYIVKVYKNITQGLQRLVQTENAMLQHLNRQNKQKRYSNPIKHHQCEKETNSSVSQQNKIPISPQSMQVSSCTSLDIKESTKYRQQYMKKIKLRQANSSYTDASVRVLEYIEGTLLAQVIADHLLTHHHIIKHNDPYYGLILHQIPKIIANYLTNPLYAISQNTGCEWDSKLDLQQCVQRLKQRQWEWHAQSFIQNELFYKKRHQMIAENQARPKWHSEIVSYFVDLYKKGLGSLNSDMLRKSIIHHDNNQWNIVINKHFQVDNVSFIDFGNLKYSYLIEEISIYTLYMLYNTPHISHINFIMPSIIQSYSQTLPITLQELKFFYLSVPMRMCLSLCNSVYAEAQRPDDEYIKMSQKNGWALLKAFKQLYNEREQNRESEYSEGLKQNTIFKTKLFERIREKTTIKVHLQVNNEKLSQKKLETQQTTEQQIQDEEVEAKIDCLIQI